MPGPRWYWDLNNNGVAGLDDGLAGKFQKGGTGWDANKEARLVAALATWRNATDFNPTLVASSVNVVYVDQRVPFCVDSWPANTPAANCVSFTNRSTYVDIHNSKLYLNEAAYNFSSAAGAPPANVFHMQGIFTHELGHAIFLKDLYGSDCPPGPTMCGSVTSAQSYNLRDLLQDDITGPNVVYAP